MSTTFVQNQTLVTEGCCNCGILFAMPYDLREEKRIKGGDFYCPNGHSQHYTKPENQKLREYLAREQSAREQAEALANDLKDRNDKITGKLSRVYKRVRNGVCPCCNRHFSNLEDHMKTKHGEARKTKAERATKHNNARAGNGHEKN